MNKTTLFIALCIAAILYSCNSGPKPESIAEEFLNAYLSTDYKKAASYCTPALSQDLLKALEEAEALNDTIKANIKKHTQNYTPQSTSTVENARKDPVTVYYTILNGAVSDTSGTKPSQIIESVLYVVKKDGDWRVNSLN